MRDSSQQMRSEGEETGIINGGQSAREEIRVSLRGNFSKDWSQHRLGIPSMRTTRASHLCEYTAWLVITG